MASPASDNTPDPVELLNQAVDEQMICTLALPMLGTTFPLRSRLLMRDAAGALVFEFPPEQTARLTQVISDRATVSVQLRIDHTDLIVSGPVLRFDPAYKLPDASTTPAMVLAPGYEANATKRRKNFRVTLDPGGDGLSVKLWKINEYVVARDRAPASAELRCEPLDLSPGGLRLRVYAKGVEALKIQATQRVRLELRFPFEKGELVLEGRIRHPISTQRDDESAVIGVSFENLDRDIDGRRAQQSIARYLAELQRNQVARQMQQQKKSA
jgi:hypothetical protein